jgi:hypothetical protein
MTSRFCWVRLTTSLAASIRWVDIWLASSADPLGHLLAGVSGIADQFGRAPHRAAQTVHGLLEVLFRSPSVLPDHVAAGGCHDFPDSAATWLGRVVGSLPAGRGSISAGSRPIVAGIPSDLAGIGLIHDRRHKQNLGLNVCWIWTASGQAWKQVLRFARRDRAECSEH